MSIESAYTKPFDAPPVFDNGGTVFNVKHRRFSAKGNGIADDSQAIQDAIDAVFAAGGGVVFFPEGEYLISTSLILKRGVSYWGVAPGVTPTDSASWDLGFTVSSGTRFAYPGGIVFTTDPGAATGTAAAVDGIVLRSLGFTDVAQFLAVGGTNQTGLAGARLENIIGDTTSGIALDLINPMHVHVQQFKVSRCYKLLRVQSDYDRTVVNHQPGNSYFSDIYGYISTAGHAEDSLHLHAVDRNGNGTPLNYIHMDRVQVNKFGSEDELGRHVHLQGEAADVTINGAVLLGLDLEGGCDVRLDSTRLTKSKILYLGASDTGGATADLRFRNSNSVTVESMDDRAHVDIDGTCNPIFYFGPVDSFVGTHTPLGMWWDRTLNAGASLGLVNTLKANVSALGVMDPSNPLYIDLQNGGGLHHEVQNWSSASTWVMSKSSLGFTKVSQAGTTGIQLPDAATCKGMAATFKRMDNGVCTISCTGTQKIDGAATNTYLDTTNKFLTVQSDGANWLITAKG